MGTYKLTFEDGSEALCHFGVLGMKWGHRKDGRPQGSIGSGPEYMEGKKGPAGSWGRSKVNSVLSPRAKRIAKGVAIGAGVAAAAYGAHKLGLDKAAVDYVRNFKRTGSGSMKRQVQRLRWSTDSGKKAVQGVLKSNSQIHSQVKKNTASLPTRVSKGASTRLKVLQGQLSAQRRGAAAIRTGTAVKPAPHILSSKGQQRVSSVLKKPTTNVVYQNGNPIRTVGGAVKTTSIGPNGKPVYRMAASVRNRNMAIDAKKAAEVRRIEEKHRKLTPVLRAVAGKHGRHRRL